MSARPGETPAMDAVIEVQHLFKRYPEQTAVDGISFAVPRGEFFGLLGPNGAGKTTTIRMLYGFTPPTRGVIRIFGLEIGRDWRRIKMRMGVCQQDNTLDPDLTVEQNLVVFAGYFGIRAREARDRARELLEFFALSNRRAAKVMDLSGGMIRRLTLARSLINRPELLILDEPTTGLDPQSRHQVWDRLEKLKASGLTVVLTTHYMEEASRMCDRLVIVDRGRILVEGSPEELILKHAGRSVIEVGGPDQALREHLKARAIPHDDLGRRLVLYTPGGDEQAAAVRADFCNETCTFRSGTLEDVFLRLTGRELRD
jgi:lipooligosaccharide transport system ATP-binding protein